MKKILFCCLLGIIALGSKAQDMPRILSLKERASWQDMILEERFNSLLPNMMRKNGIDMWVIIGREYNEDPVLKTFLPSTWLSARRRTILVIYDKGEKQGLEALAIARYNVGNLFQSAWKPEEEPNQWKRLMQVITERNPKKIGINLSPQYAHADGLTHTEYEQFMNYLPTPLKGNITDAEKLCVAWLETRTPQEMAVYETLDRITHEIIAEAFSEKVIVPGITTTDEVVWFLREKVASLHLDTWFQPTVDIQRPANASKGSIIMPGDLLHCDFGITYLRLNTDVQEMAYVLKPDETQVPAYLQKAFQAGNHLQNILTGFFKVGMTGNQILALSLRKAEQDGVTAQIYSHPVGNHGHAAGPAIGMWDMQGGVVGTGDYQLNENTAYAIELNAKVKLPEWQNQEVRIMLEEQGLFTQGKVHYIDGRQKQLLTIPRRQTIVHLGQ